MALVIIFQGGKTLSIHPARGYQWGNRLGEVQCGAWGHLAGHDWPSLARLEVTSLLGAALWDVLWNSSLSSRGGCIPMEETQRDLSGRTSVHLSPSYVCALNTEPFCFGLAQKSRFWRLDRWDTCPISITVQVPGQINQDLDLNLLGQHRRKDAF